MRLSKHLLWLVVLAAIYAAILPPMTSYMKHKPFVEKLGLLPRAEFMKVVSVDQKQFIAATVIGRVLTYYGSLMSTEGPQFIVPPDYQAMSRAVHLALALDPYNMDGYYFAQGILAWDVQQYQLANNLLESGMKYRTWDWQLPYFAAFNYAYFLKDYPKAAQMYQRAGELSGNPLLKSLAGRYLQQSGQTQLAMAYLSTMERSAKDPAVRKTFQVRLHAFRQVRLVELARDRYRAERGRLPSSVEELVAAGYLKQMPVDPYGGTFYFNPDGSVTTTSKFAFAGAKKAKKGM